MSKNWKYKIVKLDGGETAHTSFVNKEVLVGLATRLIIFHEIEEGLVAFRATPDQLQLLVYDGSEKWQRVATCIGLGNFVYKQSKDVKDLRRFQIAYTASSLRRRLGTGARMELLVCQAG